MHIVRAPIKNPRLAALPDAGNPDPFAPVPTGWSPVKRVRVNAGSNVDNTYSHDINKKHNTHKNMKYDAHAYGFVATAASTTVTFTSLSAGNSWWGPVLDNVRLVSGAEACNVGGWETLWDSTGDTFKNQGDCESYLATGGKNTAAGE